MTTKQFMLELLDIEEDAANEDRSKVAADSHAWTVFTIRLDRIAKARRLVEQGPEEPR